MRNPDNRRQKLKEWFSTNTIPASEKSYISQLMSGTASFGEKAATRLEATLGMPDGYLDSAPGTPEIDAETLAVQMMMASTDAEGRIRIKFAASDALYEYNQKKERNRASAHSGLSTTLIDQISSIKDPALASAIEVVINSFTKNNSAQKQG